MDCAVFKGEWEGQFGTLSFKDANNHIVHVATRVQAKENATMYVGLLTKTMEHPGLRDLLNSPNMTCFTDKHKGSDSAVPKICPLTEDRRCVEHLIKNMGAIGTVSAAFSERSYACEPSPGLVSNFKTFVTLGGYDICVPPTYKNSCPCSVSPGLLCC